jgi:phenylacetate-CoA ligase
MLVIRGVNVFPTEIEAVLLADGRIGPHYVIVEDRRQPGRPELRVAVEPVGPGVEPVGLGDELARALRERLGIGCVVRAVAPGTVPRPETGKAQRLERWAEGDRAPDRWRALL